MVGVLRVWSSGRLESSLACRPSVAHAWNERRFYLICRTGPKSRDAAGPSVHDFFEDHLRQIDTECHGIQQLADAPSSGKLILRIAGQVVQGALFHELAVFIAYLQNQRLQPGDR